MNAKRSDGSRLWRTATGLVAAGMILGGIWNCEMPNIGVTTPRITVTTLAGMNCSPVGPAAAG